MAIIAKWDDSNQTRVLLEFETTWTWDEFDQALERTDNLLATVSHTVDIIIDLEGAEIPNDYLKAAQRLLTDPSMGMRPNEGHRVVVGANKWIRTAYNTLQKTFSKQLQGREILFANDLSQARGMLYSMRLGN
ncbi:MAG: hypothetical protein WBC91_10665 [Phototrophicaceae bacterium]